MKSRILLLDSFGALLTAILLFIIRQFEHTFGISGSLTSCLISLAILLSIFSALSYKFGNQKWKFLLKIIAMGNLLYCGLTVYLMFTNFASFKSFGKWYFAVEVFIILILSAIEFRIATRRN
jgi:hypothetical protein